MEDLIGSVLGAGSSIKLKLGFIPVRAGTEARAALTLAHVHRTSTVPCCTALRDSEQERRLA